MIRIRIKMTTCLRRRSEKNFRSKGQIATTPIRNKFNLAWNIVHLLHISDRIIPLERSSLDLLSKENLCLSKSLNPACFLINVKRISPVSMAHQNMATDWTVKTKMMRLWVSNRTPIRNPTAQLSQDNLDILKVLSRQDFPKDHRALGQGFRTKCSKKLENKKRNRN